MRTRSLSQSLRKEMTKEKRRLWYECFKKLPVTVNRQKVLGRYIVNFYCAAAKLVIEIDGSQHYEPSAQEADRERDQYLRSLGLTAVRYTNADVNKRFSEVCADVYRQVMQRSTSSIPSGQFSLKEEVTQRAG